MKKKEELLALAEKLVNQNFDDDLARVGNVLRGVISLLKKGINREENLVLQFAVDLVDVTSRQTTGWNSDELTIVAGFCHLVSDELTEAEQCFMSCHG